MDQKYITKKFISFFIIFTVFVGFIDIAFPDGKTDVLEMRWTIDEALRSNPELQSAKLRWDASRERILQARSLDDPTLGFTYFGEQVQTRVGEKQAGISASQKIPFYGKRRLKGEIAEQEAKVTEEIYRTRERDIIARAKSAFYELYWHLEY